LPACAPPRTGGRGSSVSPPAPPLRSGR
jgi:hypothetical protein